MGRFGFVGPSYTSQSPNADAERCLNWYPERLEGAGKSVYALYPTPGLAPVYIPNITSGALLPGTSIRGLACANNLARTIVSGGTSRGPSRAVAITGNEFYELTVGSPGSFYGAPNATAVTNDSTLCSMVFGPTQVLVASAGSVYVYDLTALTLTQVAQSNFNSNPVSQVAYCDGFFLALNAVSNQWYASAALDATTWPGTSTTKVSVFPNNVVSMIVNQRQVWMLGSENSVVYYNSGNSPFPFDVISGSLMEQGCAAVNSVAKMDNSIFWLGGDSRGQAMVWRANGYTPQRVSNHAVEFAMQGYSKVSDAVAYAYQDQGHSFYQIYFPSANGGKGATWVYDAATGLWHEKAFLNPDGTFSAHHSWCHAFVQQTNQHLVGDWSTNTVYQMAIPGSPTTYVSGFATFDGDSGNPIKRLRRAPVINLENEWIFHHQLDLDLETGIGASMTGASTSPSQIFLQSPNGNVWTVTLSDGGAISVVAGGTSIPGAIIILNDATSNTTAWQLGVSNAGALTQTAVTYSATYPQTLDMATLPSFLQSGLQISNVGAVSVVSSYQPTVPPRVMLRWSDDNGHTWSNEYLASAGQVGQYRQRVRFSRMGRARQRIYELSCSDTIPWRVIDAYLKATPTYQAEERLSARLAKSA